jgi:hypothetical protein
MIKQILLTCAALIVFSSLVCGADLGGSLTPLGAERAGNKDGTIPEWEGKDVPLSGWSYGKYRGDYWKHKNEKPLFSIDASNVDKYKDHLTPSQIKMIKQTNGYRMDVYPTHRNAGAPDYVYQNTKKNLGTSKLDGSYLADAILPGVPFPIPKNGLEVMWNFLLRYQGYGQQFANVNTYVAPTPGSSRWIEVRSENHIHINWAKPGSNHLKKSEPFYELYVLISEPVALAGQAVIQKFYYNKDNETFYYFPGQRRVRRMPTYAYDAPMLGFENQIAVDESNLFWGMPDRFDWKLIGKKEIYVPYNCFKMYKFNEKKAIGTVLQDRFVNPEFRRYEKHRVWVVEGTVKKGMRHTVAKKVFYFDEDSWIALVSDAYDGTGSIWKMAEAYPIPEWETGAYLSNPYTQYDLKSGRWVSDMQSAGTSKDFRWFSNSKDPKYSLDYYSMENLRAICDR